MGAFILSNKNTSTDVLKSKGHKKIDTFCKGAFYLTVAKKITIENENCLCFENGDFIIGLGTFVYKDVACSNALIKIYNDFDYNSLKEEIWGHYAMAIKKGEKVYIFCDRGGLFRIFYHIDCLGNYCVSSSFLTVVSSIENPKFDAINLAAYVDGIECPFIEDCNVLKGKDTLVVSQDGHMDLVERQELDRPKPILDETLAISYVRSLLFKQIEKIQILANELKCPVSSELTGGLDSRLIACLVKRLNIECDFVNYPLNGMDKLCADLVAKEVKKVVKTINHHPIQFKDIDKHLGEFDLGFNYFRHYPRISWNYPNPIQLNGFRGEGLSTYSFMDNDNTFTILKHLKKKLSLLVRKKIKNEYVERQKTILADNGFSLNQHFGSYDQNMYAHYIYGTEMDGNFISAQNAFIYFISLYAEYNFYHALSAVVNDVKRERRLVIKLIKEIDKQLANVRFSSHIRNEGQSVNEVEYIKDIVYTDLKPFIPDILLNLLYKRRASQYFRANLITMKQEIISGGGKYNELMNVGKIIRYPFLYKNNLERLTSVEILRRKYNISL